MTEQTRLRPIERVVLRLHDDGLTSSEIADRLRRGERHVERILSYTRLPGRTGLVERTDPLRPVERRVLDLRSEGVSHERLGTMFRRSPEHMRRIEGLAHLKLGYGLLEG